MGLENIGLKGNYLPLLLKGKGAVRVFHMVLIRNLLLCIFINMYKIIIILVILVIEHVVFLDSVLRYNLKCTLQ